MFNWRIVLLRMTAHILGRKMFKHLDFLKKIENETPETFARYQEEKLSKLLIHSYMNVPYYRKVLDEAAVIREGKVCLENFQHIPVLTKDIIRREGENLYSRDHTKRSSYPNSSGGSTGEPVRFIQDRHYKDWSLACAFYLNTMAGKDVGEPELKLWGSERDILKGSEKLSTKIDRWLFNVEMLNSFLMTEENIGDYVRKWNRIKPKLVNAYTSSIYDFARHIKTAQIKIFRPQVIICSAETLTPDVRNFIEETFGCPALNHYGSRDGGMIACECLKKEGLHTFPINTKIEILDDRLKPCQPGQMGNVYVTTLDNFSMPLIRYSIGDMAIPAKTPKCSCGRGTPLIETVVGRHIEVFKTRDGKVVPGEFFIHFVGVVYNKGIVKKFQVIQKKYDYILIKAVILDNQKFAETIPALVDSIRKVMGQDCKVEFEYVDDIPPTKSGKYLYTISEL
ncbi:MAG: phenylacetate--CoA ligase family protein [Planctomycetota bacterium]